MMTIEKNCDYFSFLLAYQQWSSNYSCWNWQNPRKTKTKDTQPWKWRFSSQQNYMKLIFHTTFVSQLKITNSILRPHKLGVEGRWSFRIAPNKSEQRRYHGPQRRWLIKKQKSLQKNRPNTSKIQNRRRFPLSIGAVLKTGPFQDHSLKFTIKLNTLKWSVWVGATQYSI